MNVTVPSVLCYSIYIVLYEIIISIFRSYLLRQYQQALHHTIRHAYLDSSGVYVFLYVDIYNWPILLFTYRCISEKVALI